METKSQMRDEKYAADISSIREAQVRISPFIHKTPVLSSETLNSIAGRKLHFKCECFQKGPFFVSSPLLLISGAFKFRGACNAIFSLNDDQAAKGVVTHSSIHCNTKNAPKCKVENVIRYNGQVIWSEPTMRSREDMATKVLQETGAVFVHPYNDGRIISGQGTISLELLEQAPQIDTIIVPISGLVNNLRRRFDIGGGIGCQVHQPLQFEFLAAEPKGAMNQAAHLKEPKYHMKYHKRVNTRPIVRDFVDDIITVEDKDIIEAMRLCYEILKVAVEPSGAIGLAAVLSDDFRNNLAWKDCNNIGIILSGGNVDLGVLWDSFLK
ncbi:hypothetical protein TEA_019155 [Camellia sinensis var. sinensis]|uniref:Tryptophan synthase beta chain-like PALP domain-containing protein n=1 Tax=Camellia sinensis var. sinensis TaxID=542762 RepID=A0A4S4EIK3_CAMSN|nr:hypothetical protein TEA_019155 [Camellia sinensis var. sinensis]